MYGEILSMGSSAGSSSTFVLWAFVIFLVVNILTGIHYGKGVKNIRQYALGNRNFSMAVLVSTITATMMGGGDLLITTYEVYKTGLHYAIAACLGIFVYQMLVAQFFIPRMGEFLGSLSIADALGSIYGKKVRIIAAISASARAIAHVAIQFKVLSTVFDYALPIEQDYTTFFAALVVIAYSSFGGMKSVAFTDLLQFFTFLVTIPMLLIVVWNAYAGDSTAVMRPRPEIFNIGNFIGWNNSNFWEMLVLFSIFALPGFSPALFQRIAVGKTVIQVKKAFTTSAAIFLFIMVSSCFISYLVYQINPGLDVSKQKYAVIYYVMDNYTNTEILAVLLIGISAMAISTADSYLHSASTIMSHDLFLQFKKGMNEVSKLLISKSFSVVSGLIAVAFAIYCKNLREMLFWALKLEVVSVPVMLTALGFRTSPRVIIIGMMVGVVTVILWETKIINSQIESIIPSRVFAALSTIAFHYFLRERGGWVGIKDKAAYDSTVAERNLVFRNFREGFRNFSFLDFCKKTAPDNDFSYTGLGVFSLVSYLATMYAMSIQLGADQTLLNIYQLILILSFCLMSYPIWPVSIKKEIVLQVSWNFLILLLLPGFGMFFLVKSGFSAMQLVIFTTMIIVTLILARGLLGLAIAIIGSGFGSALFHILYDSSQISYNGKDVLMYMSLIIGCIFIIFLQPRFRREQTLESLGEVLREKVQDQSAHLLRVSSYKQEFISRLDNDCMDVLYDVRSRLDSIKSKLANNKDFTPQEQKNELATVAEKVASGSEYLLSIIDEIEQSVKLDVSKNSLKNFMNLVYKNAKSVSGNIDVTSRIDTDTKEIECDQKLIHKVIKGLIVDGMQHGFDEKKSTIGFRVSDYELQYDLSFTDSFQETTHALKIDIIFDNIMLTQIEKQKLSTKEINKDFSHWLQIIFVHYGKLKVMPESKTLTYSVVIPSKLSAVRPKKMDLPDQVAGLYGMMQDALREQERKIKAKAMSTLSTIGIDKEIIKKALE